MKRLITSIVMGLVFLGITAPALAAPKEAVILLDASWSMQGFFETHSICGIVDDIRASLAGARFAAYNLSFKDKNLPVSFASCSEVRADGKVTLIDIAYQNALKRQPKVSALWLITDNVQDPHPEANQINNEEKEENDDIRKFYAVLEQDRRVARVYVFIRTPDFAGPIYQKDGKSRLADHYSGKRGLLIYGILLDPTAEDEFEKTIELFAERSREKVPPNISQGTPVKGFPRESVKAAIEKVDAPHVTIRKLDNALVFQKVFREEEPIRGDFDIRFISGPANLAVDKPEIDVAEQDGFRLYGDPHLSVEVPQVSAVPPQLDGKLLPASSATVSQRVRITITFPQGVTFPHSPRYLWNYLWQPHAAVYKGSIRVRVKARARDIDLAPAVLSSYDIDDSYFTRPTEDAQKRIYGLKYLFQQLHSRGESPISIPAEVIPVEFSVSPPQWPVVVLVILGVMLALMAVMLARSFSGRQFQLEPVGLRSYRLASGAQRTQLSRTSGRTDDANAFANPDGNSAPDLRKSIRLGFFGSHPIAEENERLGELRRKLSGITVSAAPGYVVNGSSAYHLPGRGGTFSFQKPADAEANHDGSSRPVVTEKTDGARRTRSRSESKDFFG